MKHHFVLRAALSLVLTTLMPSGLQAREDPAMDASGLVLSIELDSREYAIGQPVLALISVKNAGDETFRDLTILDPGAGFLRIQLSRDGVPLPWTGHRDHIAFGGEGISLRPGEEVCEITDFLAWFGSAQSITVPGHGEVPHLGISAGKYSVVARLSARTGVVRSLPQVEVKSVPVTFSVTRILRNADSEWEVLKVVNSFRQDGRHPMSGGDRKRLGARALDSRYFYSLIQLLGLSETDLPARELLGSLRAKGRTPVFMAAAIDLRCLSNGIGDREKRAWIEGLRSAAPESELARVLSSWLIKLREHCFYPSFGP